MFSFGYFLWSFIFIYVIIMHTLLLSVVLVSCYWVIFNYESYPYGCDYAFDRFTVTSFDISLIFSLKRYILLFSLWLCSRSLEWVY